WSWGWQARNTAQADPDKEVGACIWLWTRDRRLCNAPELAGPDFDTSFTQQEITLPRGVRCSIGDRSITRAGLTQLTRVTGDPGVAFSAAYARAVLAGLVQVDQVDVLAAERAIIASHFRGRPPAPRPRLLRSRAGDHRVPLPRQPHGLSSRAGPVTCDGGSGP